MNYLVDLNLSFVMNLSSKLSHRPMFVLNLFVIVMNFWDKLLWDVLNEHKTECFVFTPTAKAPGGRVHGPTARRSDGRVPPFELGCCNGRGAFSGGRVGYPTARLSGGRVPPPLRNFCDRSWGFPGGRVGHPTARPLGGRVPTPLNMLVSPLFYKRL
jgi:hypothetical protein